MSVKPVDLQTESPVWNATHLGVQFREVDGRLESRRDSSQSWQVSAYKTLEHAKRAFGPLTPDAP